MARRSRRPSRLSRRKAKFRLQSKLSPFRAADEALWRTIHLLADRNSALRSRRAVHALAILRQRHQLASARRDAALWRRKHDAEAEAHIQRAALITKDLYNTLNAKIRMRRDLQAARREVDALKERMREVKSESPLDALRQAAKKAEKQKEEVRELRGRLETEGIEAKIYRCALLSAYKTLPSLKEREDLGRLLELSRQHFTGSPTSGSPTPEKEETPLRETLPLTPVSLNSMSELPPGQEERSPRRAGLRPRKRRVSEQGSPLYKGEY